MWCLAGHWRWQHWLHLHTPDQCRWVQIILLNGVVRSYGEQCRLRSVIGNGYYAVGCWDWLVCNVLGSDVP